MEQQETLSRVCACLACGNPKEDIVAGNVKSAIYGNCCGNCGFYSPDDASQASGVCCKLELSPGKRGMNLYHRKRGELRGQALIVGGSFSCNSFSPVHEVPKPETFWRAIPTEGEI